MYGLWIKVGVKSKAVLTIRIVKTSSAQVKLAEMWFSLIQGGRPHDSHREDDGCECLYRS